MSDGRFTYYWINDKDGPAYTAKSMENYGRWRYNMPEPLRKAKKVWCQGPKGGVRLVNVNWWYKADMDEFREIGYITNIPEAMQEFAWVVLSATPVNIRI